jgi:polygalacturonase
MKHMKRHENNLCSSVSICGSFLGQGMTRRRFGESVLSVAACAAFRTGRAAAELPFEMTLPVAPVFAPRVFDIRKEGAVAGGAAMCTQAIAAAVEVCAKAGGGRVLVPAGVWLTGPIHLKSNVELHVAEGAELRFSQRFEDYLPPVYMQRAGVRCYGYSPLVYARGCTNVAVTGRGTLNGQGEVWWPWKKKQPGMGRLLKAGAAGVPVEQRVFASEADGVRPPFVQFIECRNVLLEGFTLNNGPSWNIHPVYCENLIVRGVSVVTHGPNNDGIDPDSCRNVLIEECLLDTGDDCICLKAGRDEDAWAVGKPCENVVVRHCRTKRGHGGVVFGSEMSAGIRNVLVHDCEFDGTDIGLRFKSLPGRGGYVENIWCRDIRMDRIRNAAVHMTFRYRHCAAAFQEHLHPRRDVRRRQTRGGDRGLAREPNGEHRVGGRAHRGEDRRDGGTRERVAVQKGRGDGQGRRGVHAGCV